MKNNKLNPISPELGIGDKFGLGIQVFKIESSKVVAADHSKTRQAIKNIENPTREKPNVPIPKKAAKKLPSIEHHKD